MSAPTASGEQRFCSQCGAERFGPFCWRCGAPAPAPGAAHALAEPASAEHGEAAPASSFDRPSFDAPLERAAPAAAAPALPPLPAWVGEIAVPGLVAFAAALLSLAFPWLALLIGLAGFVVLVRALLREPAAAERGADETAGA